MSDALPNKAFLTPGLSLALDVVRCLAALVVALGHARQLKVYQGPWPIHGAIEHDAVIVFFVLSGLVITSAARQRETTLYGYAVARFARIVPVAWLSIVFCAFAYIVGHTWGDQTVAMPWQNNFLGIRPTILPTIFLSEATFGVGPVWNPPYWSLAYEVAYYAFFGVFCYLRGWRRALSLLVLVALSWPRAILLMPIWLMGSALAIWGPRSQPNLFRAGALLAVAVVIAYLSHHFAEWVCKAAFDQSDARFRFSQFVLTDIPMGFGIALGFIALRDFAHYAAPMLVKAQRPIAVGARTSFPLYLFHYPAFALLVSFGLGTQSPLLFAVELSLITLTALLIGNITEGWRLSLRSKLM